MTLFICLLIAHLLGDFFLQSAHSVKEKQALGLRSPQLYIHGLIHGVLMLIALSLALGTSQPLTALLFTATIIAVSHTIIDLVKREASIRVCEPNATGLFILDQLMHVMVLLIACHYFNALDWGLGDYLSVEKLLIHLCAIMLLTRPSSFLIQMIFKDLRMNTGDDKDKDKDKDNNDLNTPKRVGQAIGVVERMIIYSAVLAGQWQAVGFLIAAKSIFRFGDLTDPKTRDKAEMILLGTLLSFGIGIVISWVATSLLNI